eukprot:scaffold2908_cov105-Isochrysis_galbana.AAC.8
MPMGCRVAPDGNRRSETAAGEDAATSMPNEEDVVCQRSEGAQSSRKLPCNARWCRRSREPCGVLGGGWGFGLFSDNSLRCSPDIPPIGVPQPDGAIAPLGCAHPDWFPSVVCTCPKAPACVETGDAPRLSDPVELRREVGPDLRVDGRTLSGLDEPPRMRPLRAAAAACPS